ncbi:tRNA lysidine(34) synthetase TilS [Algoriphagus litoralis]|uniref:tRNA lysidine(34) synthetase TilS n=1 Tax=Algoriphagus litoralis TaxID=2202829 RepID=UPI000DB9BCBF|nr:tRNA lysidine(34) synthetase TilS [Algoriphagus litoralis]
MLDAFQTHIFATHLLDQKSVYLLACSGGMDSMCLGDLLVKSKIPIEIAHVNFQLRGTESKGDQEFVETWSKANSIPFHLCRAETEVYAQAKGISVQMAAREIRYAFFEKIRAERNLDGILLAHHEDDQVETIFLNLLRGTGIEGIYGMADKKGWLIRPLLPFSREEIRSYMDSRRLLWRDDSSNDKADYKRNNLRINGLPAIYSLGTDAKKNLLTSFQRLKDTGKAFGGLFETWQTTSIREESGYQYLPFAAIQYQPGAATLLYFWLRPFGFNSEQAQVIAEGLDQPKTGAVFQSATYSLHFDRKELILAPKDEDFIPVFISGSENEVILPEGRFSISRHNRPIPLDKNPIHAQLDESKLEFPLEIRSWQEGDRFNPLGMSASKKLSDFLIDLKVPLAKKRAVKVLVSGGEIAWVIGMRIADWAKCTPATQRIVYFKKI